MTHRRRANHHMRLPAHYRALSQSLLLCVLYGEHALGAEKESELKGPQFSAEVGVGVEYDSNVSVEEVDASSGASDYAYLLDLGLRMRQELPANADLSLTYDFSQSLYDEFSLLDRQTHILGADISMDIKKFNAGLSTYYINSRLDGNPFLELYRVSPSVSGFLAKKWFARAAYVYAEKSLNNRPGRNADSDSAELDLYYFHRGLRSYLNLGYRYRDEVAGAARYDYISQGAKVRYVWRFDLWSRLTKLELAWRYEDRNYSSITPSIGEKRADIRNYWKADMEIPLFAGASVQLYYAYGDYDSNYEPVDYTQNLIGTLFIYRW